MYTYMAELPQSFRYETPMKTDEGILDWKNIHWILNPENRGVANNIPRSIEKILYDPRCYEHRCFYEDGKLINHESREIDEGTENITDNKVIEEQIFSKYFKEGHGIK
jgi:8-oxo-dGTP diphosphatase